MAGRGQRDRRHRDQKYLPGLVEGGLANGIDSRGHMSAGGT
jgi:hypothetical protein